jgi:hypothetical protein
MALIRADRVCETTTTTGTGALTLAAAVAGYRRFSAAMSTSDTCYYAIEAIDVQGVPTGDWEVGLGTYSSANTLTRTTVHFSSNSNSAVSFAAGTKRVFIVVSATDYLAVIARIAALETATKPTESIIIAVGDETTAITTGTAKVTFRMPYAFTVTGVRASLATVSSSGIPTVDINEAGTTILSTKLTIDASEFTSTTAATPAVISDSALADDAEITIDIDVAGTGAKGLKVVLIGHQ